MRFIKLFSSVMSERPYCPKCGFEVYSWIAHPKENWVYCPRCGAKLKWRKLGRNVKE